MINKAIISSTMTVIAPDEEDVSNIQQESGRGGMNFRNFGDGETKMVTYIKGDIVKTVAKTDMGRTTIIRDNSQKKTTTLIEMMGNKTGFVATDEEQAAMRKSMDSAMRARQKDTATMERRPTAPVPVNVSYTEETKKIAGYVCKKAYLISTRILGLKDTATVWFTPEFKSNVNIASMGGGMNFMGLGGNAAAQTNGAELIDGFIMRYETKMRRNRTMIIEVNKIDFAKDIADKEFEIPKDFDVKPMKEMRAMMGGGNGGPGMQFEIRRGNN